MNETKVEEPCDHCKVTCSKKKLQRVWSAEDNSFVHICSDCLKRLTSNFRSMG